MACHCFHVCEGQFEEQELLGKGMPPGVVLWHAGKRVALYASLSL